MPQNYHVMIEDMKVRMRRHRRIAVYYVVVLFLLMLGSWAAYLLLDSPELGIDDARIFFVYGENIVEGDGIVFNAGGERVEGFTSPLWLFLVVIAFAIFNRPDFYLLLLGLLILSGAIAALWYLEISRKLASWRSVFFLLWIAGTPAYIFWMSLPLMDTTIWSAILIFSAIATIRSDHPLLMAVCMVLLVLARPEGIVWGLVFISLYGIRIAARKGITYAWRTIRLPFIVFILTILALTSVRLAFFGYPLPNTYYAKVSPDIVYNLEQGVLYLVAFVASNPLALIAVLWASAVGIIFNLPKFIRNITGLPLASDTKINIRYLIVSVIAITGLVIPIISGGDHFRLLRFYQPVWPLLFLPILAMFATIKLPENVLFRYGLGIGAVAIIILIPGTRWDTLKEDRISHEFDITTTGSMLGNQLNDMFLNDPPSVGFPTVGGFAQEYDGEVIDIYGLNNVSIAHSDGNRYGWKNHAAFSTDEFLRQQPDLFLPATGNKDMLIVTPTELEYNAFVNDIYHDQRFVRIYSLAIVSDSETSIRTFIRRDIVEGLLNQGFDVIEIDY